MFAKTLTQAGHTRSFFVQARDTEGWEVSVQQDSELIRRTCYSDWHRLERALNAVRREVAELEEQGWRSDHALTR